MFYKSNVMRHRYKFQKALLHATCFWKQLGGGCVYSTRTIHHARVDVLYWLLQLVPSGNATGACSNWYEQIVIAETLCFSSCFVNIPSEISLRGVAKCLGGWFKSSTCKKVASQLLGQAHVDGPTR